MGDNPFLKKQVEINQERNKCQFCPQVQGLSTQRREQFHEALMNPAIEAGTIVAVLENWGVIVSKTVLGAHRRGNKCVEMVSRKWSKK